MRKWAMEPYALPYGAKGIEGDGFAVEFRGDKIVFVPKAGASAMRYTLHACPNSGVIDLHETGGDGETHRTLFAVRKDRRHAARIRHGFTNWAIPYSSSDLTTWKAVRLAFAPAGVPE